MAIDDLISYRAAIYSLMGRKDAVQEEYPQWIEDDRTIYWSENLVVPDDSLLQQLTEKSVPELFKDIFPADSIFR